MGAASLALVWVLTGPVAAEERCPAMVGASPALGEIDAEERIAFLQRSLLHDARQARIWAGSWGGVYTGLLAWNGARLGLATTRDDQIDATVATAATSLGLIALVAMPLKVMRDQRRFDALLAARHIAGEPCALLAEGERLLLRGARSEVFGKSNVVHAGNFVFNVGLGLLLGAGFGHWTQGTIVSLVGMAVGELQTFTQPTDVVRTLARYRDGDLHEQQERRSWSWTIAPMVAPGHAGLQLSGAF